MTPSKYEPQDARVRELEPPYKSDAEARIGRMLDRYELPFFYRQPRLIYDQGRHDIWHPTYTLPTYNSLVVEYADPSAGLDYGARQRVYSANGIASVVAATADLEARNWERRLRMAIEDAYQKERSNRHAEQLREG